MTEDEAHSALAHWLGDICGALFIKAHPDAPRPGKPYGMVNLISSGPVFEHPIEDEFSGTDTVTQAPVRDWFWRFSVHAYGDSPSSLLRKAESAFKVKTVADRLLPLIIFETSMIRNVPDIVDHAWEPRANMDIELRGIVRDGGFAVDVIEETSFAVERA